MLAVLITIMGALPEPRYDVENIVLTQNEMVWLLNERQNYERDLMQRVQTIGTRVSETETEIAELQADHDASQDQNERTAILAQITAIENGTVERGKIAKRKVEARPRPMAADARKVTVNVVYNPNNNQLRVDPDSNGALSRAESGWPAFVFNAIDANGNNVLTVAEIQSYWSGLEGSK